MTTADDPETVLAELRRRAEHALDRWLPAADTHPAGLHRAMRYSALGGGKRIRAVLVYAAGQAVGVPLDELDGPACATELIHAYSLVHDDLPAMDDDDLRRGHPTCHKAFDEATAILVGDAMQSLAFYVLSHDRAMVNEPAARLGMVETLALASGSRGMAGGQAIDLGAVGRSLSLAELEDMHIHKTGALIRASVLLGAMSQPTLSAAAREQLDRYAKCLGLAFQIRDDILDVEGDPGLLGKSRGADLAHDKPTYPSILGLEASRTAARQLHQEAVEAIADLSPEADTLRWIADFVIHRVQ